MPEARSTRSAIHSKHHPKHVPEEITNNPELQSAIASLLPPSHEFEVPRTVHKIQKCGALHLGLQMPEGLLQYATNLADIFKRFAPSLQHVTVFGDVCFGACCIDDLGARALGIDLLVHYAHSCLVPVDQTAIAIIYIHVSVKFNVEHLVDTIQFNFKPEERIVLMSSVQFSPGVMEVAERLQKDGDCAQVPRVRPLGTGDVLGCTSPVVTGADILIFVCDGRFHLESAMIQNPQLIFYRYDPVLMTLTREGFAHDVMHTGRKAAIEAAKDAQSVGLILGTLGRQGSSGVLEGVERLLDKKGIEHTTVLLSDISPERLNLFSGIDAWVQVACPRLSLDWGVFFQQPLLTTYEAYVAFGNETYKDTYPMDYYSNKGGPWANYGAHRGHGGSLSKKFQHLGQQRHDIEFEKD